MGLKGRRLTGRVKVRDVELKLQTHRRDDSLLLMLQLRGHGDLFVVWKGLWPLSVVVELIIRVPLDSFEIQTLIRLIGGSGAYVANQLLSVRAFLVRGL